MTRKEGYLVLDKIFKDMRIDYTSLDTILKSDRVEQFGRMESKNFSFVYLGFKYFYKPCTLNHIDPYFELIAEELLADFNLLMI